MTRISFGILIFLSPTIAWGQPSPLEEGQAALANKEYDQAIRLFSDLLTSEPGNVRALALRAGAYIDKKELEKAGADCEEALNLDLKDADDLVLRGRALARLGKDVLALVDFNEAIRVDAGYAPAYSERSAYYIRKPGVAQSHGGLR